MKKSLLLSLMVFSSILLYSQDRVIEILTYHTHAPFIIAESKGLTYDLADYLSEKSSGRYQFVVLPMSRMRIDRLVEDGVSGIIPWVNPQWFQDTNETRYMWTRNHIMRDGNAVISSGEKPMEYEGPDSIKGLRFGGVRGHRYVHIDDLVETGEVSRVDNENHLNNFRMLIKDRIDFTIAPLKGAQYIISTYKMENDLYISENLHSSYARKIIINDRDRELRAFLDSLLGELDSDEDWLSLINSYR